MSRLLPLAICSHVARTAPFFCGSCGGDRIADVCDGRRRVVLRSVPIAPWTKGRRHVRCTSCDATFPESELDVLTSAELADRLVDLTRILTAMTVRTGEATDRDLRRRAVQHVRTAIPTYHQNLLDQDLAEHDPAGVSDLVAPLADVLEVSGKERLVAAMVQVALAAHTITPHQRWLLATTGTSLGLTPMHITGIISAVAAAVEPSAEGSAEHP